MSATCPLRKGDLDEYILFRHRLQELLHLWTLWGRYGTKPDDDPEKDIGSTVGIAVQVWLHSFFDPRGLNVLRLWPAVFPTLKVKVRAWEATYKPVLKILEEFRHTTGAHFSKKIDEHNRVRQAFTPKRIAEATESFMEIAGEVVSHESERPELITAINSYGLPPALLPTNA